MVLEETVQLHAKLPRALRRRFRVALAVRDQRYVGWLHERVLAFVNEVELEQQRGAQEVHGDTTAVGR